MHDTFAGQANGGSDIKSSTSYGPTLPVSASSHLALCFYLCNGGSGTAEGSTYTSWEFDEFEAKYLAPMVGALRPVLDVSVVSQVSDVC